MLIQSVRNHFICNFLNFLNFLKTTMSLIRPLVTQPTIYVLGKMSPIFYLAPSFLFMKCTKL